MPYDKRLLVMGLMISMALSVGITLFGILVLDVPLFAGFLLLPFLPVVFSRRLRGDAAAQAPQEPQPPETEWETPAGRSCPRCGWSSDDPEDAFCPRHGTRLV